MNRIVVDISKTSGEIKPVNAVNNGPSGTSVRGISNFEEYRALEIPYARNHDASFYANYGGEHTVDVHRIFKNFDADETDPASYVFESTDMDTHRGDKTASDSDDGSTLIITVLAVCLGAAVIALAVALMKKKK